MSQAIRESKVKDYPREFPDRRTIYDVLDQQKFLKECNTPSATPTVKIAGRIMARRDHGNNIFFDLMDQTGTIQLHGKRPEPTEDLPYVTDLDTWKSLFQIDLGDCIGVNGILGENPRGEPLFKVTDWVLLAKAIREPPDKHHGLNNPEMKYRHRELDLLSSEDTRNVFIARSEIIRKIRRFLFAHEYIDIETPTLQPIYGGATANPFITHHKALDQDYYLSISSELYLKRALVGGFDRVYSISRCFRNEGISPEHNPEFTNVEIFATCETYFTMRKLVEQLITELYQEFLNRKPVFDVRMDMPTKDWPLSRKHTVKDVYDTGEPPVRKEYAEAWELYIDDMEIASGASDLNDPAEQKERLYRAYYSEKDDGYNPYDENYIEALEQGLLPVAGVGIGIDRLVMLLTEKENIRDVIMFPTLKSK